MRRATAITAQLLLVCAIVAPAVLRAQPKVLTEIFSNTACGNCKSPDEAYETFLKNNPSYGIQRIVYHNDFPSPYDTFYVGSKVWVDAHRTMYGVTSDPSAFINGKTGGANEVLWETYTKSAAVTADPISITVAHNEDGTMTIHAKNTARPSAKVRWYIALIESNILMQNTQEYGMPVSGRWDDIFRMMLPNKDGSAAFTANGNDEIGPLPFDPTEPDNSGHMWDPENMKAVAYLQDDQPTGTPPARHVYAIGVASLATPSAVHGTSHSDAKLQLRGNPVKAFNQVGVALSEGANVRVVATDMLGRIVHTIAERNLPRGSSTVEVNPASFGSGCYLIQLFVNGHVADQQKLIVE